MPTIIGPRSECSGLRATIDAIANMYPVLMVSVLGNSTAHVSEKPARTANSATTVHDCESPSHANAVAQMSAVAATARQKAVTRREY